MNASTPRARPEVVAGIVNALVVWLFPLGFLVFGDVFFDGVRNTSTAVRAVDPTGFTRTHALVQLLWTGALLLPFAMLAGWRTWYHARRRHELTSESWQGVLEAGACGLVVALGVLSPGIVTRPFEAAPYVLFYGGAALILGLVVGVFLRTTALLVLKLYAAPAISR